MAISQNTALFSILGTMYGGDGRSTFALPNIQGNVVVGPGQGPGLSDRFVGETGGSATVTLLTTEMPSHTHTMSAINGLAERNNPAGAVYALADGPGIYQTSPNAPMNNQALSLVGGSQPHNNMMPYLTLNYCIALQGIFPPRS